ncbi:MAG TPA: GxxExxY protein [Gemmatimonadaceae bacterium]|nr:GxxExxY protein [Gemmatimonadaceae bacterium]
MARIVFDPISARVVAGSVRVHRRVGPGLLEGAYEKCLAFELRRVGLTVQTQVLQSIVYDGVVLEGCYRVDMLVNDELVVEIKTVDRLLPIHHAQLLSYLRLGGYRVGLLLNFRAPRMKDGIVRIVN